MKGKHPFLSHSKKFTVILIIFIVTAALWDAVFCDEMMNIKDFYTEPWMLELIKAAESNDLDKLKQIVHEGIDPNTFSKDYMSRFFGRLDTRTKKR